MNLADEPRRLLASAAHENGPACTQFRLDQVGVRYGSTWVLQSVCRAIRAG
jgi:hypothetical protein